MLSPAPLLSEIRSSRCQEADSSPKGPTATLGSDVPGLRSLHRRYRWKALGTLDSTAQKTADFNTGCALMRRLKIRCAVTLLHAPPRARTPLCHISPRHAIATSALVDFDRAIKSEEFSSYLCLFKHRGHTIDRSNMCAGILQRSAALTASESLPTSDAASSNPVSLTTLTYSIADLQALFSQVQALSSNASNPTLSVTPGISSEWFLDSACCNHMMDNPHLTSAHTPPVLPIITTADGSAMTVSHVGSISTPNLSVSDVFCVSKLHLNLLSVGQLTELGLNLFFSSRGCLMQDSWMRQIVGTARKVGRLFDCLVFRLQLTSLHFPSSSVSAPVIAASASIEL
uniref:Retrovirus-related Pol polyprotein from transposon TNT 1-94-like beta-barrel domain-containing protein n=1 Tax=Fagus sylvatica TaxID=28930 RepID=A0A2N9J0J5_FAGSY